MPPRTETAHFPTEQWLESLPDSSSLFDTLEELVTQGEGGKSNWDKAKATQAVYELGERLKQVEGAGELAGHCESIVERLKRGLSDVELLQVKSEIISLIKRAKPILEQVELQEA